MVGMPKSFCTLTICPARGCAPICTACWPLPSVLPPRPCCEKPHRPTIFIFYVHSRHCLPVLAVMCATGQPRKSTDIQTENRDKNSLTDFETEVMCASCTGCASERWSANAGTPLCPGGGIGRRAGFRCQWPLWPWKFESSPGHQIIPVSRYKILIFKHFNV